MIPGHEHFPVPALRPKWLALSATWNCNARCTLCDLWKTKERTMLEVEPLMDAVNQPWFDCIENVAFFGGEPTLNPQIVELYGAVRSRFPWAVVSIVTWGGMELARKRLEEMARINPQLWVCVSLDGDKETHDERRGKVGAYEEVMETLALCKSLFKPRLRLSWTATGASAGQVRHVAQMARKFDADVSMRPAADGQYFNTIEGDRAPTWTAEQIDDLEAAISEIPNEDLAMPGFAKAMPEFLRTGEHIDCQAPVHAIVCDPDLQARVCHGRPPLGHLKDYPDIYAQHPEWWEAMEGECFRASCFIDGPYSIGYAFKRGFSGTFSRLPVVA